MLCVHEFYTYIYKYINIFWSIHADFNCYTETDIRYRILYVFSVCFLYSYILHSTGAIVYKYEVIRTVKHYPCKLSTATVARHTQMQRHTNTQDNEKKRKRKNDELFKFIVTVRHIFCTYCLLDLPWRLCVYAGTFSHMINIVCLCCACNMEYAMLRILTHISPSPTKDDDEIEERERNHKQTAHIKNY